MSELTPHLSLPVLEDPAVTRVREHRVTAEDDALLASAGVPTATSVCVVVPVLDEHDVLGLEAVLGWDPPQVRLEVVVVAPVGNPVRSMVRATMTRSGHSWRLLEHPRGGRVGALAAAADTAEHEFLVVPGSPRHSPGLFDGVPATLMAMWRAGADAAVLGGSTPRSGDASHYLVAGMGLAGGTGSDVVVLRRWVARWVFNEATRAIAPAEEVADRTRLLGVGILAVGARDDRAEADR